MDQTIPTTARRNVVASASDRTLLLWLALLAVLVRLPLLLAPLGIDEGGYAFVADQWVSGSGSLYGAQWVDRPPLLIGLFAVAIALAGDVGIRLLGCAAAFVTVWACGRAAARVGGRTAMLWSAGTAIALVSSTAIQGQVVNAEVPAIAFTAVAIWWCIEALGVEERRARLLWASGSGAAAASALLVKQSHVDALVFACVALLYGAVERRGVGTRRAGDVLLGGLAGFVLVVSAFGVAIEVAGPGVGPMFDAVYGFRVEARSVIEAAPGAPDRRALLLVGAALGSGILPLLAVAAVGLVGIVRAPARRIFPTHAIAAGLLASLTFGVFAVTQGGNWWLHYLLQVVPALAIATGVVVASAVEQRRGALLNAITATAILVCIASAVSVVGTVWWANVHGLRRPSHAAADWLQQARAPGDTGFVAWGHPDVLRRSGLGSSYDMSWSLPIRVRDPQLRELKRVITGTDAPDWIVEWNGFNTWSLDADGTLERLVRQRYAHIGSLCGHPVYRLRSAGTSADVLPALPTELECGAEAEIFGVRLT